MNPSTPTTLEQTQKRAVGKQNTNAAAAAAVSHVRLDAEVLLFTTYSCLHRYDTTDGRAAMHCKSKTICTEKEKAQVQRGIQFQSVLNDTT